jgi:hypothetical protein
MTSRRFTGHLVGGGQQRFWDGEAEGFGGLEIYDQLKLGRLDDRQVGGFLAVQYLARIDAGEADRIQAIGSLAH